eukprot:comp23129_c2_seq1/m.37291 comp23129_c2_seq1/g.37291  ORF comp23129_c2_seq1/g.37291 comp23129_c2_seq1/m.37291 type:complete len:341 (-) comp23129_c2_seq1:901-1923(-)
MTMSSSINGGVVMKSVHATVHTHKWRLAVLVAALWVCVIVASHSFDAVSNVLCVELPRNGQILIVNEDGTVKRNETALEAENRTVMNPEDALPIIYFVTPTVNQATQRADLTRLANTLNNVPRLHWVVVEDANQTSQLVEDILQRSKVFKYSHISATSPNREDNPHGHRGVNQRNAGLKKVLEESAAAGGDGVLYFGDDDNAYDLRLFEAIRSTNAVSCWAMGFSGGRMYERCTLDKKTGKVNGFVSNFMAGRKFVLDMGAFAVNLKMVHDRIKKGTRVHFSHTFLPGFLETKFIQFFITEIDELEPKGNCTEVWVWHTKTVTRAEELAPANEPDEPLEV